MALFTVNAVGKFALHLRLFLYKCLSKMCIKFVRKERRMRKTKNGWILQVLH